MTEYLNICSDCGGKWTTTTCFSPDWCLLCRADLRSPYIYINGKMYARPKPLTTEEKDAKDLADEERAAYERTFPPLPKIGEDHE